MLDTWAFLFDIKRMKHMQCFSVVIQLVIYDFCIGSLAFVSEKLESLNQETAFPL